MVTNELLDITPGLDPLTQLEQDVETMVALFPDCDPIYLRKALSAQPFDLQRVQNLSMFDNTDYPKSKVREENERLDALKKNVLEDDFNLEHFLCKFPHPGAFSAQPGGVCYLPTIINMLKFSWRICSLLCRMRSLRGRSNNVKEPSP